MRSTSSVRFCNNDSASVGSLPYSLTISLASAMGDLYSPSNPAALSIFVLR